MASRVILGAKIMTKKIDELTDRVRDIDARCSVQELLIALLARVGIVTGDPHLFVNGVMQLVGNDLKDAANLVTNKEEAQRAAYALESFAELRQNDTASARGSSEEIGELSSGGDSILMMKSQFPFSSPCAITRVQ